MASASSHFGTDEPEVARTENRGQLGTETEEEAHDNECKNNARKSERKDVADVVSRDISSGPIRGYVGGLRLVGVSNGALPVRKLRSVRRTL